MTEDFGKQYHAETDRRRGRGCLKVAVWIIVLAIVLTVLVSV